MGKRTMILPLQKPTGEIINIPLIGPRFHQADINKSMISMRMLEMDGWSILDALVPIILFFRPYCIVEIGAGESTKHLAKISEAHNVKLYSCDKSPKKNVVYHENHIFIQKFSHDFIDEFDDTPSVVLIDADHAYEIAKMEFDFFYERLVPGGVIFLHDTMPPSEEFISPMGCDDVYKLRQELEKDPGIQCFTWPYTSQYMGLTMVIKKEKDLKYFEE